MKVKFKLKEFFVAGIYSIFGLGLLLKGYLYDSTFLPTDSYRLLAVICILFATHWLAKSFQLDGSFILVPKEEK